MEQRERTEDVLEAMRGYADGMDKRYEEAAEGDKRLPCNVVALRMRSFANRLEAAVKREAVTDCNRLNAAKMREALEEIRDMIMNGGLDERCLAQFVNICNAALAAPIRNCDMYADVDEARKAHEAICEKYAKCHHGCPLNHGDHYSAFDCFEAWLFAPAKEGGAK